MGRKCDIFITALFCGFIGIMAVGTAVLPKQTVSINEKRTLAKFPAFSGEKMLNGSWEKDFETYISDHFPIRDFFAATDSYYMLYTGRNGANGVYKGKDGYLFNTPVKCDESKLNANIKAVVDFSRSTGIKTKIMPVPTSGYIQSDKLPSVHGEYKDAEIIGEKIKEQLDDSSVELIEVIDTFLKNRKDVALYYKTDHHWTSAGAYIAYKKMGRA